MKSNIYRKEAWNYYQSQLRDDRLERDPGNWKVIVATIIFVISCILGLFFYSSKSPRFSTEEFQCSKSADFKGIIESKPNKVVFIEKNNYLQRIEKAEDINFSLKRICFTEDESFKVVVRTR
ncbi:hypothetical protein EYS14_11690 [Alteromonadaceae bacterium M269]|nr:hypothetical protein EYS14_11690 [Alteromonadaceae bacterium M269]